MLDQDFVYTLLLTGKLALVTTTILVIIGIPVAYWITYSRFKLKFIVEALICMPMVLPPTVMGYYLLVAFSPDNAFGQFLEQYFDVRLAFSFNGIVIASIIANLPFMIQPLQNGFSSLSDELRQASYTMGKSKIVTLIKVLLPNIKTSVITGIALTFAHCIGEFGIVIMVGGNIPKETRIASVAIYDQVQALNFEAANRYAFVLFILSFLTLVLIYSINRKVNMTTFR
ncbi:molybdate ABC transporter permease subunit [Chryseobacterium sp.]|jgi:molybdate transport system permease protein|uniref:molybdate ABC transporter permease subunit n=1 Tax=Chryseobacterium sp. TaxID=1871047 RepID=UPI002844773B|nr:molybdate ABC transporter permease subunit [Chryseobacterium sp.]MDR3025076.1 molybdate ABC transporter permease subunit [Chryseobacterium sp.]